MRAALTHTYTHHNSTKNGYSEKDKKVKKKTDSNRNVKIDKMDFNWSGFVIVAFGCAVLFSFYI